MVVGVPVWINICRVLFRKKLNRLEYLEEQIEKLKLKEK